MSDLFQFIAAHWLLSSAFVIVLVITVITEWQDKEQKSSNHINTQTAINLINRSQAVVIDLRETEPFSHSHIIGSKNFPSSSIQQDETKLKKLSTKTVILVSENGIIKPVLNQTFKKYGFENLKILQGGIKSWKDANLPLSNNK